MSLKFPALINTNMLLPGEMPALLVHAHFAGLEVVELFPYGGLVFGRQPGPRFVCPSVVLVAGRHLDVVVELDDLKGGKNEIL